MIIKQLEPEAVSDNGGLPDRNIGEGSRMNQAGLVFYRIAQSRIDRIPHPCCHGSCHLQILGSYRIPLPVIGKDDISDPFPQILQIHRNGKDRHQLRGNCNVCTGLHPESVHLSPAKPNLHFPECLAAEIHHKIPLHPLRINVQPAQPDLFKARVIVIALMLHSGIECGHRQIVRVCDVIDVPGQPQGKLRHGNQKRIAAACRSPLHIHGRPAGRLPETSACILPKLSETFDQPQGGRRFSFSQRSRSDRRHLDVLSIRLILEPFHDLDEIQLRRSSIGDDLILQKTHL